MADRSRRQMDKQACPLSFDTYPLPLPSHRQPPKGDFERTKVSVSAPLTPKLCFVILALPGFQARRPKNHQTGLTGISSAFADEKQKDLVHIKTDITRSLSETMRAHSRPGKFSSLDEPFLSFIPPGRRPETKKKSKSSGLSASGG